jgi:hypothetical protein
MTCQELHLHDSAHSYYHVFIHGVTAPMSPHKVKPVTLSSLMIQYYAGPTKWRYQTAWYGMTDQVKSKETTTRDNNRDNVRDRTGRHDPQHVSRPHAAPNNGTWGQPECPAPSPAHGRDSHHRVAAVEKANTHQKRGDARSASKHSRAQRRCELSSTPPSPATFPSPHTARATAKQAHLLPSPPASETTESPKLAAVAERVTARRGTVAQS